MRIHNKDANTIELRFKNGNVFFFSYETPVAARIDSRYYKTSKHHSSTTTRHINRFLHGDTVNAVEKPQYFFDEEIETVLSRFMTLIEPLLLIIMGIIIASLLAALYMPLIRLGSIV